MANGILIVNKPAGWTSQDVAAKLRGVYREKRVGHGGTLDPMATGVLPIFIGRATRAVPFFEHADKTYEAVLRLGIVTDTQDITGRVLQTNPVHVTQDQLEQALARFRGEILQIPPMYSAIKVNGQKLYALARKGQEIERAPRPVTIYELELVGAATGRLPEATVSGQQATDPLVGAVIDRPPEATGSGQQATEKAFPLRGRCPSAHTGADEVVFDVPLSVHCSKGTYVRTLCHDIGQALGCGGCMAALRRTRAGRYCLEQAHTLEEILSAPNPETLLLPTDSLFSDRPALTVTEAGERRLRNGADHPAPRRPDGEYRVYSSAGAFLLLGQVKTGVLTTVKSFFEV